MCVRKSGIRSRPPTPRQRSLIRALEFQGHQTTRGQNKRTGAAETPTGTPAKCQPKAANQISARQNNIKAAQDIPKA